MIKKEDFLKNKDRRDYMKSKILLMISNWDIWINKNSNKILMISFKNSKDCKVKLIQCKLDVKKSKIIIESLKERLMN